MENLLEDYQNAQCGIEEATAGLFSFNQADKYEEVSIASVDKEAETNEKKTSKRDIIVVDDKGLLFRHSERIPKNTKKVTFWCLNVWNELVTERNALPQNYPSKVVVLFVSVCNAMRVGELRGEYYFYFSPRGLSTLIFP